MWMRLVSEEVGGQNCLFASSDLIRLFRSWMLEHWGSETALNARRKTVIYTSSNAVFQVLHYDNCCKFCDANMVGANGAEFLCCQAS